MIDNNYNEKFRKFFDKFFKKYNSLSDENDKEFLWNLAINYVEKNRDFIMQYPLIPYWEKSNSKNENDFLKEYENKDINLYFHVPFCKTKCSYCSFHIIVGDKNKDTMSNIYFKKIESEVIHLLKNVKNFNIKTIFIGGGTPSFLEEETLNNFLFFLNLKLKKYYDKEMEFCFEGNPDSFNLGKLKILKKYGVNRLSIGVQSFDEKIILKTNRNYSKDTIFKLLKQAKNIGFNNIGIDLMYGLPGQTKQIMKSDLKIISKLDIQHITYYPLYYYNESILKQNNKVINNIKDIYGFYDEITKKLKENGYTQYGREYFCKDNKESKYQSNYLSNGLFLGFGQSSCSFNGKYAFKKYNNIDKYINSENNISHYLKYDKEYINRRLIVLGSRNINIKNIDMKSFEKIEELIKNSSNLGLIKKDNNDLHLTKKGLKYQEILTHIFI